MRKPGAPGKTWDLTINNYTDEMVENLKTWHDDVTRMVVAKEVGPAGTPHLQMKVTFKVAKRFSALKKLVGTAHIEESAVELDFLYCKKLDSDIVMNVDNRHQGKRSELKDACDDAKNGKSMKYLWANHTETMVRYSKGIKEAQRVLCEEKPENKYSLSDFPWEPITDWSTSHIIVGAPEIGKTCFAKAHFENPYLVSHNDELLDFDPLEYDGIVFDDMDYRHTPRTTQIHITDQDDPRAIHCRFRAARIPAHTKKIFTCNVGELPVDLSDPAISRRVTVTEVGVGNTVTPTLEI